MHGLGDGQSCDTFAGDFEIFQKLGNNTMDETTGLTGGIGYSPHHADTAATKDDAKAAGSRHAANTFCLIDSSRVMARG